jgi:hypothetical protein
MERLINNEEKKSPNILLGLFHDSHLEKKPDSRKQAI